jgi:hypothetical protein
VNFMPPLQQLQAMPADPPKPTTHDITIVTTKKLAQAKVLGVPPEEFGIERGARNIKDCNYCFHEVVTKSEAQLIAEGFDETQIKALSDYTGFTEIETLARDTVAEHLTFGASDSINRAARLVKITEHYVRMDYEGNGRPCLYQVITGGDQGEVLKQDGKPSITRVDVIPFAVTTPVPVTHRFFGRSIADLVMSVQREKTALKRGALDNLYLHNNPRVEVAEANAGANTLDDLLVSRPGGVVRTKIPGGLNWQVVPDITASVYPMLTYLDAELETKTGVTKQGQGIDANALQNQTATAVAQVFSASQMRMKLIARIIAEGVKDMFSLLHGTIRKHGQQAQTVRLRNKWVEVDPRDWKNRNDMTIAVGLGSGGKAQQFAQLMALGNVQKELLAGGKANLVDDQALFNTASELAKIMGHKNADKFFNDPSDKNPDGSLKHPPLPPPVDPKVQIEQMKAQTDQQANQQKAALAMQDSQIKAQQAADKAQLDAFHQKVKTESEVQLAREKHELDAKLALLEAALKEKADARAHELHQQKMGHAEQAHQHNVQKSQLDIHGKQQEHRAKHAQEYPDHATADQVNQTSEGIKGLHEALANHAKAIEEAHNAPVEIVRDKSGKAAGIKKGNRTMKIDRGPDGKARGLH